VVVRADANDGRKSMSRFMAAEWEKVVISIFVGLMMAAFGLVLLGGVASC
jgi:hypothetical protein